MSKGSWTATSKIVVGWGFVLVYSLYLGYEGWGVDVPESGSWPAVKIRQAVALLVCLIAPPIWFWIEYFFVAGGVNRFDTAEKFERFKYGQEISSRIWLGVSSALLILYFGKDLKGPHS